MLLQPHNVNDKRAASQVPNYDNSNIKQMINMILIIVTLYNNGNDKQNNINNRYNNGKAHRNFSSKDGDLLTLVNIYDSWIKAKFIFSLFDN